MNSNSVFRVSDEVVGREVGGETVLLNLSSGLYFGLDSVGGEIWQLLEDEPRSFAKLCDEIDNVYDAPRTRIEADMKNLLKDLLDKELVELVGD
ncbi:PqqD family protein [Erythrobacter sp. MTPC3]|uniref:PqqD family protein n=1 Tax=Erythrobacter sp. MTPC3 TaxID=3056564 RepID=UPI0036F3170B